MPEVGKEQRVDNRSYDPDQQPSDPIDPSQPTTADSHIIGEHHEMPTPIDPASGIAQDLSVARPQTLEDPAGIHYHTYSEVGATPDNTPVAHGGLGPEIPPPAQHVAPQGYPPGPGIPPPPQGGRGFPWLPCCGVTCGLLLVLTVVFVFVGVKYFKPLINAGIQLGNISEEVKTEGVPDTADIKVTPAQLSVDGAQYENQWVELTGKVTDDPGPSVDSLRGKREMENSTGYVIDPNIIVLDVKSGEQKAQQGETIRVIGKPVFLDFEMLGPTVAKQIEQDSGFKDIKQFVFLITDDIEVVQIEQTPEVTEDTSERET